MTSLELAKKFLGDYDFEDIIEAIEYNISGGKGLRSQFYLDTVLKSYDGKIAEEQHGVAFAIEVLHAASVIMDDIIDNAEIRRNKPCYYKTRGYMAFKDGMFFISLFKKYLNRTQRKHSAYIMFYTSFGELLDCCEKTIDSYNFFTYNKICEYKTSLYTIFMPIYFGMTSNTQHTELVIHEFARLSGIALQMLDDFVNFVPEISMKTNNDLEEMKITFFTCMLAKEHSDQIVKEYFNANAVTGQLIEKVFGYLPAFFDEVSLIIGQAKYIADNFEFGFLFEKVLELIDGYYFKLKKYVEENKLGLRCF